MPDSLQDLRRFAVARSLFAPTTLKRALDRLGFVQADPIRAPARAQDLILRQRVRDYRAGDLERRYVELDLEEDFFLPYGFVTRPVHALMHPRSETRVPADNPSPWPVDWRRRSKVLLDFVRQRGTAHPREVNRHFAHGKVRNWWGGSSNSTTFLLDAMHYRGMLRVARREAGIRVYEAREHGRIPASPQERRARLDALVDIAVGIYAPLPEASLRVCVRGLRFAVPQWREELASAFERAKARLAHVRVEGVDWYWPAGEKPGGTPPPIVRLLTPFDPVVRDRDRFELLWGWVYRFEAYTPARKRKLGYYALPLLWEDRVIGWGNVSVRDGRLVSNVGYVHSPPRGRAFRRELEGELDRMRAFLGLAG
ncbi:MAG TPA: crosslink repair DNA glycosylase YcaQ family protein [Thermoanaerobaculia bacterium]|nr:crosslink repair DNA glycosylase YcaQ family protein [Thermoanaerobaculia bacterium]